MKKKHPVKTLRRKGVLMPVLFWLESKFAPMIQEKILVMTRLLYSHESCDCVLTGRMADNLSESSDFYRCNYHIVHLSLRTVTVILNLVLLFYFCFRVFQFLRDFWMLPRHYFICEVGNLFKRKTLIWFWHSQHIITILGNSSVQKALPRNYMNCW